MRANLILSFSFVFILGCSDIGDLVYPSPVSQLNGKWGYSLSTQSDFLFGQTDMTYLKDTLTFSINYFYNRELSFSGSIVLNKGFSLTYYTADTLYEITGMLSHKKIDGLLYVSRRHGTLPPSIFIFKAFKVETSL